MYRRDYKDLLGAAVLILLGGSAALYSVSHYALGTLRRLGPGAFPAVLGVMLVVFGLLIGLPALRRAGERMPDFQVVPFLAVVLGVIAFGTTIEPFGLVPSIVLLTLIGTVPEKRLSIPARLVIAAVLAAGSTVIFTYGLGLNFDLAKWPF